MEEKHMLEELYEIYDTFTDKLATDGWKGENLAWTETCRSDVTKGSWSLFELDNGFCLGLNEPAEGSEE